MLIFGSMLEDLEAYVDNSLVRDEYGEIVGRNGGIKKWLADNCPELWAKYPSVMRFKAMAKKFKQAVGLEDPYPITMALDAAEGKAYPVRRPEGGAGPTREGETQGSDVILRCGQKDGKVEKARKEARKVMAGCTRTERSLRAALEERLGIVAEPFIRGTPRGRRLAAKTHALSAARQMGTA